MSECGYRGNRHSNPNHATTQSGDKSIASIFAASVYLKSQHCILSFKLADTPGPISNTVREVYLEIYYDPRDFGGGTLFCGNQFCPGS
jgi:hypothetical protein